MKKKIVVIFILVFALLISAAAIVFITANSDKKADAVDINKYCVTARNQKGYSVTFYDNDKKVVKKMPFHFAPHLMSIDGKYIAVAFSSGNSSNYEFFYDPVSNKFSETYLNPSLAANGKIIYMGNERGEKGKLIICDIFDRSKFYQVVSRNFSPSAVSSNNIKKVTFSGSNKIYVEYFQGSSYSLIKETIELIDQTAKK